MRHFVKIPILVLGLAFLLWWGWSGNFAFDSGALFRITEMETFYQLQLASNPMGWAKRSVTKGPAEGLMTISEETLLKLNVLDEEQYVRTFSKTVFDDRGRLVSADFTVPLGAVSASATAKVEAQRLKCSITLGEKVKEIDISAPDSGPLLVSGVIPWLGHQRDVPIGRPLGLTLYDPVGMEFKPAELTIEDVTEAASEVQSFKLTLKFLSSESVEWIESDGRLTRQLNPALEAGLSLLYTENEIEKAKIALDNAPADGEITGPLADIISQALTDSSLDLISSIFGK
jgi:hypothetical protein